MVAEHERVVLAADAGVLVAAERSAGPIGVVIVYPDAACLNVATGRVRDVAVAGPDAGRESKLGVVAVGVGVGVCSGDCVVDCCATTASDEVAWPRQNDGPRLVTITLRASTLRQRFEELRRAPSSSSMRFNRATTVARLGERAGSSSRQARQTSES